MKKILSTMLALAIASTSFANGLLADSSEYYYTRAMAEKLANRSLVASKLFEKALDFNQNNPQIYAEAAQNFMEMHVPDKAKAYYTKAYELNPKNDRVIKELANLYYDFRQWDKAIEFANKCATCDNKDKIIGMSYYKKEDYVSAEKYLLKALAGNVNDAQANYIMAKNYIDAEQERKALPFFEKAIALSPDKPNWTNELAMLYTALGNNRAAVEKYEQAIKLGVTQNNDFTENYGFALLQSGNFAKGEEKLMELYKKKGNKEILRDVSIKLYQMKQYERCLDYCQKLIEVDAKDGKALYQAGLSFIKLGKKDKGQAMCDKAIEIDPSLAGKKSAVGDQSGGL
jgi:tetratricopeptide (TPR) repeat protein